MPDAWEMFFHTSERTPPHVPPRVEAWQEGVTSLTELSDVTTCPKGSGVTRGIESCRSRPQWCDVAPTKEGPSCLPNRSAAGSHKLRLLRASIVGPKIESTVCRYTKKPINVLCVRILVPAEGPRAFYSRQEDMKYSCDVCKIIAYMIGRSRLKRKHTLLKLTITSWSSSHGSQSLLRHRYYIISIDRY
jgi:hypothetical protein